MKRGLEAGLEYEPVGNDVSIIPENEHVPGIIEQNGKFYRRGAAALSEVLGKSDFLVENQFSVTDIFVGYTVNWGQEQELIGEFPNLLAYQARLFEREHCTLPRHN